MKITCPSKDTALDNSVSEKIYRKQQLATYIGILISEKIVNMAWFDNQISKILVIMFNYLFQYILLYFHETFSRFDKFVSLFFTSYRIFHISKSKTSTTKRRSVSNGIFVISTIFIIDFFGYKRFYF